MEKTSSWESVPVFVGLDYHAKGVQVCVVDASGKILRNRRCGNSLLDIGQALEPHWQVQQAAVRAAAAQRTLRRRSVTSCDGRSRWRTRGTSTA